MYHGSNTMWRKYAAAKGALQGGKREQTAEPAQAPRAAPRQAPAPAAVGGFDDMDSDIPF